MTDEKAVRVDGIRSFAHGHPVSKWQSKNLNSLVSDSKVLLPFQVISKTIFLYFTLGSIPAS